MQGAVELSVAAAAESVPCGLSARGGDRRDAGESIGVAAPVVIYFALGDRSRELLDRLKTWMTWNNAVIIGVLLLVIGVKLIGTPSLASATNWHDHAAASRAGRGG